MSKKQTSYGTISYRKKCYMLTFFFFTKIRFFFKFVCVWIGPDRNWHVSTEKLENDIKLFCHRKLCQKVLAAFIIFNQFLKMYSRFCFDLLLLLCIITKKITCDENWFGVAKKSLSTTSFATTTRITFTLANQYKKTSSESKFWLKLFFDEIIFGPKLKIILPLFLALIRLHFLFDGWSVISHNFEIVLLFFWQIILY